MKTRLATLAVAASLVAAAAWFYATPYLAMREIGAAAEAGDLRALRERVDFAAFRESVRVEVRDAVSREVGERVGPLGPVAGFVSGTAAKPVVDVLVTPEAIALMAKGERPELVRKAMKAVDRGEKDDVKLDHGYEGLDRFVVTFRDRDSGREKLSLVLRRSGIADWKLAGIRLPRGE